MHYVQLADDVIILSTSKGSHTLNRYTFNFNKIVELLKIESTEDVILPLLEKPSTPEGVYFVYLDPMSNKIFINHKKDGGQAVSILGEEHSPSDFKPEEYTFLGVYISIESIYEDWPEYAL
tara:strand:+ start:109 stop:471 length:363 start_codon:yes stop_codon:yes gene_type:complete